MKLKVNPSVALIFNAETPISQCVEAMKKQNVGSVLVVDNSGALIGIFTERDLLRVVDFIQQGIYWDRAVGKAMTKNVFTLDIKDIDQAPKLMVQKGFRHVPITYVDKEDGGLRLAGVVSMRDIFKEMFNSRERLGLNKKLHAARTLVVSKDPALLHILSGAKVLTGEKAIEQKNWPKFVATLERIYMDLDEIRPSKWTEILKPILSIKGDNRPVLTIVYDPVSHGKDALEVLEKLKAADGVVAFEKPIDLFTFLHRYV